MDVYTERQRTKLAVRPGITGYNQAYFRNSVEQNEKFENDVYYKEHISLLLDARILFKTIVTVLKRENVYNDASSVDAVGQTVIDTMRQK